MPLNASFFLDTKKDVSNTNELKKKVRKDCNVFDLTVYEFFRFDSCIEFSHCMQSWMYFFIHVDPYFRASEASVFYYRENLVAIIFLTFFESRVPDFEGTPPSYLELSLFLEEIEQCTNLSLEVLFLFFTVIWIGFYVPQRSTNVYIANGGSF